LRLDGNNQNLVDGWDHVIAPAEANFTDDVIVEWDAMVTEAEGKQIYLLFDFQDINNYSYIRFRHNKSKWVIGKVVSGLDTELAGDIFNLVRNFWLHYKVEFLNGEITVWVDNVVMVDAYNYGTISNGSNGLAILETRALFDNYKVTFSNFGTGNQAPTLSIAASVTSGPAPLEVTFTTTADDPDGNNAFLTYNWDFGDSTGTSTAQNPIYAYTAAGTFTATCVVTDSGAPAMTAQDTIEIVVTTGNSAPELTVGANPTAGNSPLDVTFTAVGNDPDFDTVTYEWDFGDGSSTTSVQNPTHQYTADGNYTATCTATDDGSPSLSTSETISILAGNIFIDDFEDGDVSNWSFRNAQYWNTIDMGGSIRLQGTQESSVDGWEHAIAPPSAEFMDTGIIEVEALVVEGEGTQFYFVFDFVDENNFGCVRFRMNKSIWILYKVVSGVWNEVDTGTGALVRDIWVPYKIEFTNGSFDLTVNSIPVASGITYGAFTSAKNGVGTLETKATFDNYKVTFTGGGSPNQTPTLTIGATPTTGSSPLEVTFSSTADDPDGDNLSIVYAWNFGDGSGTSTAANPMYSYTSDGTFTATCTITDSGAPALTAQDTQEIIVTAGNTAPTLTINASPTTGSSPLAVSFTATGNDPNGDNITYLWDFGDSSGTTPTQNPSHTYTTAGTYTPRSTVTDDGSPSLSTTETLQINVGGTPFFIDDFEDADASDWTFKNAQYWQTLDMDSSIRLQGTQVSAIDGWEYAIAPASADYQDTGIMEFDAHVLDGDGTSFYFLFDYVDPNNYGAIRIRFNKDRWELIKVVNNVSTVVTQGDVTLSRNVWEHYKVEFTNGSFSLTVGATQVATGITYGAFTSGANGVGTLETKATFDNYKVTFTGNVTPNQPPTVSVIADPTTGILPLTVTFTATGNDPEGTAMTYSWNFGDGAGTSSLQNPVYDYTTEGTFTATCTVTDSGSPQATGTDTVVITPVASNHAPTLTIDASPTSGKPSLTVDFTAVGNDPDSDNMTYSWEFGDGSPDHTSILQNPQHTFIVTGTFDVTCTVTDDGSPVMTTTENLTIKVSDSVFDDDFNDNDISDWNILEAGWSLYSAGGGEYYLSGNAGGATILAPVAAEYSSGRKLEFDVMFRSGQAYAGLKLRTIFDYTDSDNFGMVYLNGSGSYIELRKTVASTGTALYTTTYNFAFDTWYHVEITYSSSDVSMSIDSTPVFSNITYGPFLIEQIGFKVEKSALFIDNVLITE